MNRKVLLIIIGLAFVATDQIVGAFNFQNPPCNWRKLQRKLKDRDLTKRFCNIVDFCYLHVQDLGKEQGTGHERYLHCRIAACDAVLQEDVYQPPFIFKQYCKALQDFDWIWYDDYISKFSAEYNQLEHKPWYDNFPPLTIEEINKLSSSVLSEHHWDTLFCRREVRYFFNVPNKQANRMCYHLGTCTKRRDKYEDGYIANLPSNLRAIRYGDCHQEVCSRGLAYPDYYGLELMPFCRAFLEFKKNWIDKWD
ncbi:uncharacterized protein LOC123296285 [Chrysoperla carnea]|uniref:uncharacterized protein LOC123296285 n=1 Tax=Chrysoperla carnea TaxID=189513 RepID=UPI001D07D26B|nr:uncharacterized protein LOC123296285 [Chrysoperla carnea]